MASCTALNMRAGATSTSSRRIAQPARAPVVRAAVPRSFTAVQTVLPGRGSIKRFSSDTGAENDDKLVGEGGEILQGHQVSPSTFKIDSGGDQERVTGPGAKNGMGSEEKRAEMPAQGGAPEGDMAAAGQETQLTGKPVGGDRAPEAGDKMPEDSSKDASKVASDESSQQEDRAPLQGEAAQDAQQDWSEAAPLMSDD